MNRFHVAVDIAIDFELPVSTIEAIIKETFNRVRTEAMATGQCQVRGFGTFKVVTRKARKGKDFTQESAPMVIPEHRRLMLSEKVD